jgi:hypothetical protein
MGKKTKRRRNGRNKMKIGTIKEYIPLIPSLSSGLYHSTE